jgi:hypothetical protein
VRRCDRRVPRPAALIAMVIEWIGLLGGLALLLLSP